MNTLKSLPIERHPLLQTECIVATLSAMVGICSVNPSNGGPEGGERRVQEWVAARLAEVGLNATLEDALPGRPNLRVRLKGLADGPALMFQTHIDTVSTEGMCIDPHDAQVRDGCLYGRGSTDAKGQAAAMLHALMAWADSKTPPPRDIELVLGIDEEYGFGGAHALVGSRPEIAGLVIGEPTDLRVVTTHKGVYRFWAQFDGEAAHAALPGRGINAIAMAAAFIDSVTREYIPDLNMRRSGLLGPPTINVATIEGGIQPNLVPPVCRVQFERRMLPGETPQQVQGELESLAQKAARRFPQIKATFEPPILHAPAFASAADSGLARAAGEITGALGRNPNPIGVDYATDACELGALGVPTIICGPGSIGQAHTRDEYIVIEELAAGAQFYAQLMGRDCFAQ